MNGPSKSDCRNQELGYKISAQSGCCLNRDKNLGPTGGDHVLKQYEREKNVAYRQIWECRWRDAQVFNDTKEPVALRCYRDCCRASSHMTDDVATLPTSLTAEELITELKWLPLRTWMRFGTVSKHPLQPLRSPMLIQFLFF